MAEPGVRDLTGFERLLAVLPLRRKLQIVFFLFLSILAALAEMVSLGTLVPFLALLIDPSLIQKYPVVAALLGKLGGVSNPMPVLTLLFAGLVVCSGLTRVTLSWYGLRLSYGLGAELAAEVYRRTLYRPYRWHLTRNSSEVLAGIDKANMMTTGLIMPLALSTVSGLITLGIVVTLLLIDPQTAIVACCSLLMVYGAISFFLGKRIARNGQIISLHAGGRLRALREGLGGIREVVLDGSQRVFVSRFSEVDYAQKRAQASNQLMAAMPRYLIETSGILIILGLAYWLTGQPGGLERAIPVLAALAFGAQRLLPNVQVLYQSWASVKGSSKNLADVLELLDVVVPDDQEIKTKGHERHGSESRCAASCDRPPVVELSRLEFRYKPGLPPVLSDVNLRIQRGDRVGLIGATGSGKSTLIDLLMGLLEPDQGEMRIDGVPLTLMNRRTWQRRIAHVPQAIYLSDASVAENIAFGTPVGKIDIDQVRLAATRAQIAEFIETMPDAYASTVGERGIRLSGGQRQRIGIARALYKGADVLVLDEATSALDDETEKLVMEAVNALDRNLTVIMIAHRTSTLSACNAIFQVEGGQVRLIGGYEALGAANSH